MGEEDKYTTLTSFFAQATYLKNFLCIFSNSISYSLFLNLYPIFSFSPYFPLSLSFNPTQSHLSISLPLFLSLLQSFSFCLSIFYLYLLLSPFLSLSFNLSLFLSTFYFSYPNCSNFLSNFSKALSFSSLCTVSLSFFLSLHFNISHFLIFSILTLHLHSFLSSSTYLSLSICL